MSRRHLYALAGVLAAGLGLRLWSIQHGLPWSYNADEELHFVPTAVDMFRTGSLNPGYFENPPFLTYLVYVLFKLRFAAGFPFGGDGGFVRQFADDPTEAYVTARVLVAAIGTAVAGLVWWAGSRFFGRRTGLVAAALMTFAFLPVFYSKLALNDVVTMAPVCVALVGCLMAWERGRWTDWALAGAAVGVATATKYTAGALLAGIGLAALLRLREQRESLVALLVRLAIAAAAFGAAFLVLNPFSLLDFAEFRSQVGGQAGTAGAAAKLGQDDVPGWVYYAWTLTWGLGVVPVLALLGGAILAVRAEPRRTLLLMVFPVLLFLFLGAQARFFGRWLLPAYPALVILAGYGAVRAAEWLAALRGSSERRSAWALAAVTVLLVGQGAVQSVRVDAQLAHADTRQLARDWLAANVPAGSRVVVEPFVPRGWIAREGRSSPDRFDRFPVQRPFQAYEKRLEPGLIDAYRSGGYCTVVVGSHQRDRGLKAGLPNARRYYERLVRESTVLAGFSPFRADADPPKFNYDLSFNYLPAAHLRPGPTVVVYRLRDCA